MLFHKKFFLLKFKSLQISATGFNPRTEIRKQIISKKKQFKDFSGSKNAQKSILGIKINMNDYTVSFQKHYFLKKHINCNVQQQN